MTDTIAVFNQPNLNGSGVGSSGDENANLLSIIQNEIDNGVDYAIDDTIVNFTDTSNLSARLAAASFFFMTDMESENPSDASFLPNGAKDILRDFVNDGGTMVMTATSGSYDVDFLNEIFDLNLTNVSASIASRTAQPSVAGSPFEDNSVSTLPNASANDAIDASAITNGGYLSFYGTEEASSVGGIKYGGGSIFYMGHDYFDTGYANDWGAGAHVNGGQNTTPWVTEILPDVLNMAAIGFDINIPSEPEPEPVVEQSNDFLFWLAVLSVGIVGLGAIDSDIA